jgi:hypothetical protein
MRFNATCDPAFEQADRKHRYQAPQSIFILRIVVRMLLTDKTALIDSAGVLNTPALARVLCGSEISLILVERVVPKSYDKAQKYSRADQNIFHETPH